MQLVLAMILHIRYFWVSGLIFSPIAIEYTGPFWLVSSDNIFRDLNQGMHEVLIVAEQDGLGSYPGISIWLILQIPLPPLKKKHTKEDPLFSSILLII